MDKPETTLDINSISTTLPDSHTWPHTNPPTTSDAAPAPGWHIPVIDLSDRSAAVPLIRRACERWGAFQCTSHGVPGELLRRVELQTRKLFALPMERKLRVARTPGELSGYGPPSISPFLEKMVWSEGFAMAGSPAEHARQLWPHRMQDPFSDVMLTYQNEMKELSEKMMGLILESLGLTQEETKWAKPNMNGLTRSDALIRLNSYPICLNPTMTMGLGPHTATSLLTLIYQSAGASCLQVLGDEGLGWVPVHPVNGALTVIVGDLMHILSNGWLKIASHRVVTSATCGRISAAYFYGPPEDVELSPLTELTDFDHPPLYRPVTWQEYRTSKSFHFDDALELLKIRR